MFATEESLDLESNWSAEERAEEFASLSDSDREYLRDASKSSLYILSKAVLGYPDINPRTHMEFCSAITAQEKKRRLWLLPRAHLKSTIKTVAHPIQLVINEPEYTRALISSETATQAQKFLAEITGHWEKNVLLRGLFPELIPARLTGPGSDWSQARATLNRDAVHKEPHWQAIGVGGAVTGAHFSHIICDDLIGLDAYRSGARMAATKAWSDSIEPLLINQHRDFIDWVGTRWAKNDLYEHIMEFYGNDIAVFTRSAIEQGEIIFPELHSWEEYQRLQTKNPALWFAQYENNPISGGAIDIPYDALRSYYLTPDSQECCFDSPDGSTEYRRVAEMDRVMTVDPNSGSLLAPDMAAIICSGLTPKDENFVLDAWSDRVNPDDFVRTILRLARKWRPRVVGIEKAGQQNTQFYFEKLCREEGFSVQVVPLEPKGRDKTERIRYYTQPRVASGRVFLLPSQSVLRQQMKDFPNNLIVDELDAYAYTGELHRQPRPASAQEKGRRFLRRIMHTRNPRTGY
jgi:phage terminase large subunit-like protein